MQKGTQSYPFVSYGRFLDGVAWEPASLGLVAACMPSSVSRPPPPLVGPSTAGLAAGVGGRSRAWPLGVRPRRAEARRPSGRGAEAAWGNGKEAAGRGVVNRRHSSRAFSRTGTSTDGEAAVRGSGSTTAAASLRPPRQHLPQASSPAQ